VNCKALVIGLAVGACARSPTPTKSGHAELDTRSPSDATPVANPISTPVVATSIASPEASAAPEESGPRVLGVDELLTEERHSARGQRIRVEGYVTPFRDWHQVPPCDGCQPVYVAPVPLSPFGGSVLIYGVPALDATTGRPLELVSGERYAFIGVYANRFGGETYRLGVNLVNYETHEPAPLPDLPGPASYPDGSWAPSFAATVPTDSGPYDVRVTGYVVVNYDCHCPPNVVCKPCRLTLRIADRPGDPEAEGIWVNGYPMADPVTKRPITFHVGERYTFRGILPAPRGLRYMSHEAAR